MGRLGDSYPKTIAIFRALQLGDLLCTTPAFRALRKALPASRITLIGLPWAKAFVDRFLCYIDDFLEFPGYPGLPESVPQLEKIPIFFQTVQKKQFDLAIQLHGTGSLTNPITQLLGAQLNAGFFQHHEYCPDPYRFLPYPNNDHEIHRYLRLIEFLEVPAQGDGMEFPLFREDEKGFSSIQEAEGLRTGEYICIHPGARLLSRRWPAEEFAAVADALASTGLKVVLTGSASEGKLTEGIQAGMRAPCINLAGRTDLGVLAVLLKNARLLICNDTGVSHIAAALSVPSIVIVTGSDPLRWAPLNRELHWAVYLPVDCRPCSFFTCPAGYRCAYGIRAEFIISLAKKLLQRNLHEKKGL